MRNEILCKYARLQGPVIAAVLLSVLFASMGIWVRMMGQSFDDLQQTYLRILLAGLLALIVFRRKLSKGLFRSLSGKEWTVYAVRATAAYLFGIAAFTVAIQNTSLSIVSFVSTLPLVGLLALILFRERIPLESLPFLIVSAAGVFVLSGVHIGDFHFGVGITASIVAALGANVGFLMSRLHRKERSNYENTTIVLLLGWIPVFIVSVLAHERLVPTHVSLLAVAGMLLSAAMNILLLYITNYVFTNLKAYVAGNILLLEGIWALVMGLVLYGEPVTTGIIIGGLLIIVSAVAINRINNRDEEALAPQLDERLVEQ